jgi:hypothetical protein
MSDNKYDITSTAVEKSIDLVKGFLDKLLGSPIEETGLIFADNVKLRRFKNQIKIFAKAQKIVEESGINPKIISLKTLVPLLDLSSLEEEETLQDRWTNLIVNYVDSSKTYTSTIFPFILSQISTEEILILEDLYNDKMGKLIPSKSVKGISRNNLIRLGLIDTKLPSEYVTFIGLNDNSSNHIYLNNLGFEFIECCSPKT